MKQDIRDKIRSIRKTLSLNEAGAQAIARIFIENINPQSGQIIAAYEKMGSEIDPAAIIKALQRFKIVMPHIVEGSRILDFQSLQPDILIVPLIAFDRTGTRLGQGGGYYDATLEHLRAQKNIIAIGLAFAEQEHPNLPSEPHDQKLDWIITSKEAIKTL